MNASWQPWWAHWRWPFLLSLVVHAVLLWPQSLRETADSPAASHLRAKLRMAEITPPTIMPSVVADKASTRVVPPTQLWTPPLQSQTDMTATSPLMMASTGLDAGGVRTYRIALARMPALAVLQLSELPQAELEIGIAVDTALVGLIRGSGDAQLDARVLDAVRAAVQEVAVPVVLRGTGAVVSLRINTGD
ncbi:MAG TPA: hypothetical protein VL550_00220 [Rhodocyclaceae bacterium]|nr:hypothetical protein [Rhodocyclaceae bacterium]